MKSKNIKKDKVSKTKLQNIKNNRRAKHGKLKSKLKKEEKSASKINPYWALNCKPNRDFDGELSDEDLEFYSSKVNRSFAKSLSGTDDPPNQSANRKRNATQFDNVTRKPFTYDNNDDGSKRYKVMLPIKSSDKLIPQVVEDLDTAQHEKEDDVEEAEELKEIVPSSNLTLKFKDLIKIRNDKLLERRKAISRLSDQILSSPHDNIGKLKDLRSYLHEKDADIFISVKKWTMVSLMEVFKDIIPDYKIRLLTEEEQKQPMKKETKVIVEYEKTLIHNYRQYLEFLEKATKGRLNSATEVKKGLPTYIDDEAVIKTMSDIAVQCLSSLLVTHPYFNFSTNILTVLVPVMMSADEKKSNCVCETVKSIFKYDKKGIIALEIIRVMGRTMKSLNFNVDPKILNTCLYLNIKEIDMSTAAERREEKRKKRLAATKMSRKEKRLNKKKAILENELSETRASEDRDKTLKMHTEIIKTLFLSYFRILKNTAHSKLMPSVLEGLAKFAHLINIEFFDDLFSVFNKLIQTDALQYRESLHCVQTAFTILTGQGSVLNIDPIQFYKHFYRNLFHIHAGSSSEDVVILLRCLDIMLQQRKRQVSIQRILAFVKRISTISLQQLPHASLALMDVIRSFVQTYPKAELLFDSETQGSGVYLPELNDPEYCQAQNTTLWEVSLLSRHYHKQTAQMSRHVSFRAPSTGPEQLPGNISRKKPLDMFEMFDDSQKVFDDSASTFVKRNISRVNWKWISEEMKEDMEHTLASISETVNAYVILR